MNIFNIIDEVSTVDTDFEDRISPRRNVIKNFVKQGSKFTLASLPFALGGLFNKAYAQEVPDNIIEVLNFALALEHLEYRFYETALSKNGLIPVKDNIKAIRDHEMQHVKFLTDTIKTVGGTPVAEAKYDFTAKGTFPDVFSNYKTFLMVAQGFEDTGVRAYKGQAVNIKSSDIILESALQIHSVEARHAAHIRFARRIAGFSTTIKPWIVGVDDTVGTPFEAIYKGEDDHTQVLFDIDGINGFDVGNSGTSAFDEALSKNEVLDIVKPFFA